MLPLVERITESVAEHLTWVSPCSFFKPVLFLFTPPLLCIALPLQCTYSTFGMLQVDRALKLRGLIRIKLEIPKANTSSIGQQKCSENFSFEVRKASLVSLYYFYLWSFLKLTRNLQEKQREKVYISIFIVAILNNLRFICFFLLRGPHHYASVPAVLKIPRDVQ